MKRVSLAITSIVLYLVFFILYGISATRAFFSSLNATFADAYNNLYAFFNFTWDKSFDHFIVYDATGVHHPIVYGIFQVFVWLFVLVLIIEFAATIVVKKARNSSEKYGKIIVDEKQNLLKPNDKPIAIKENRNQGDFANNATPYVSLDEAMSLSSENVVVDPRIKKPRPAIRMIISIILFIITGIFIYLRMLWNFNYPGQYDLFYGLFHMDNIIFMNTELSAFFDTLFQKAYTIPMATIAGMNWSWGDLFELLAIFAIVAIVWGLILLVTHIVLEHRRAERIKNTSIDINDEENKFSSETLSVMGNADLQTAGVDISYIAKITPSIIAKERNKQLHNQAMYIYDIGENAKSAGTIAPTRDYIPPTEIRKPLVSEELEEDLSGNLNVDIKDISSIEDNKAEEVVNYNNYLSGKEELTQVNLENIDVSTIALLQKKVGMSSQVNKVDDISFDEDGYAYLMKKGKPFLDEQVDISDVIDSNDLEKSVIISRYGTENFDALNSLEPFDLRTLDYDEEIENIRIRKRGLDIISSDRLLKESLSKKPFIETNVEGIDDIRKNVLCPSPKEKVSLSYTDGEMNFKTGEVKEVKEVKKVEEPNEFIQEKIVDEEPQVIDEPEIVKEEKIEKDLVELEKKEITEAPVTPIEKEEPLEKAKDVKKKKVINVQQNITAYNVPKIDSKTFTPIEKFDQKKVILIKPQNKVEEKSDGEVSEIKPIFKPIKPISVDINFRNSKIKPVEITSKNFVSSFADAIKNSREKDDSLTRETEKNNIELLSIKKDAKPDESIVDSNELLQEKERIDKVKELKSIVSIDKIEQEKNEKKKPAKPVDVRKVGYDVFIGKKK